MRTSEKFYQVFQSAFLLFLLFLVLSSCASSVSSRSSTSRPPATPSTMPCTGTPHDAALLFFHRPGRQDGVRCIEQEPLAPYQLGSVPQIIPFVAHVYRICANQEVFAEYDSAEDPTAQAIDLAEEATGSVWLDVQAHTCQSVRAALNEESMPVTGMWFEPFFGIQGSGPEASLIHQIDQVACAHRSDFFRVWYDGGKRLACYANAGVLTLAHPLTGVTKVCSGLNAGSAYIDRDERGFSLNLEKMHTCATADLVHENTVMVTTIDILPASSAA